MQLPHDPLSATTPATPRDGERASSCLWLPLRRDAGLKGFGAADEGSGEGAGLVGRQLGVPMLPLQVAPPDLPASGLRSTSSGDAQPVQPRHVMRNHPGGRGDPKDGLLELLGPVEVPGLLTCIHQDQSDVGGGTGERRGLGNGFSGGCHGPSVRCRGLVRR